MNMKCKRALIGYDPGWVEMKINSLSKEYSEIFIQLEYELSTVNSETQEIKDKIQAINDEIHEQKRIEEEIIKELLSTHYKTTEKVFDTMKRTAEAEKKKIESAMVHEREYAELKKTIKELIEDMQPKVEEYKHKLNVFESEEVGE